MKSYPLNWCLHVVANQRMYLHNSGNNPNYQNNKACIDLAPSLHIGMTMRQLRLAMHIANVDDSFLLPIKCKGARVKPIILSRQPFVEVQHL